MGNENQKKVSLAFVFLIFFKANGAISATGESSSIFFPKVEKVQGKTWVVTADNVRKLAQKNMELKGSAKFEVEKNAEVTVKIDPDRSLTVFSNSEVNIPTISWDDGQASIIELKKGVMKWNTNENKPRYTVLFKSDLFNLIAESGTFVILYDPLQIRAELRSYFGKIEFSAMNGEHAFIVSKGQKGIFQGIKEQGEIIYDILLEGKKVPRGELKGPLQMSKNELYEYSDAAERKKQEVKLKKILDEKKRIAELRKVQICVDPYAKYNECSWTWQGAQCIRSRCDAGGNWGNPTVLTGQQASACKKDPVIGPCDY